MKKTLLTIAVLALTVSSFAQGTLYVGNNFFGRFRAPIYGPELASPGTSISGQSSLGLPSGDAVYSGPLLQGTNFTFAVYYGPSFVIDPGQLTLLTTTTFRTAAGDVLPAGLIYSYDVVVPGILPGETAKLQVRVWDNDGGLFNSWDRASTKEQSAMFSSLPLGGLIPGGGILHNPEMTGWTSFGLTVAIPEPKTFVLAGLGAAALLIFRRRN